MTGKLKVQSAEHKKRINVSYSAEQHFDSHDDE